MLYQQTSAMKVIKQNKKKTFLLQYHFWCNETANIFYSQERKYKKEVTLYKYTKRQKKNRRTFLWEGGGGGEKKFYKTWGCWWLPVF